MPEYISPGVYVEEFDSGPQPTVGVSTSITGFTGMAIKGPTGGAPQLVSSMVDFNRKYGGYLSENQFGGHRFLAYAVEHFFINGGNRAFISRVAPSDATKAESVAAGVLKFHAANVGAWGNELKVVATSASKAKTQIQKLHNSKRIEVKSSAGFYPGDVIVLTDGDKKKYNRVVKIQDRLIDLMDDYDPSVVGDTLTPEKILSTCEFNLQVTHDDVSEIYEDLSFNSNIPNYIHKRLCESELITVETEEISDAITSPFSLIGTDENAGKSVTFLFEGGCDGSAENVTKDTFIGEDNGPGLRTGIQAFIDNDAVNIMVVPGVTDPAVQAELVRHCENMRFRFAILDVPRDLKETDSIITHRKRFDSANAAMYHPWLTAYDPLNKRNVAMPPSGAIAGIYARIDSERGVHKAPANEVVRGCVGLDIPFNTGEQDILNPQGVNLIRSFPGQGIRVWGARTCSSDSQWKYVNVRRLFIYIEESIRANTNWVVFEPNNEALWARVKRTVEIFLDGVWRNGILSGASPDQAFYVDIGCHTMTQDDIDNRRLICVVGIAPVKPMEFISFRVVQRTGE